MENNKFILYCGKTDDADEPFIHFFGSTIQTRMCGFGKDETARVQLEETEETEGTYWGFKNLETNEVAYIFSSEMLVKICSPDGFKGDVREGKGKFVRLKITELPMD